MLKTNPPEPLSEFDLSLFEIFVPEDHYLRKVLACIDFESFRQRLAGFYNAVFGRPAIDPVRMLKILFLCFHYRLSDREVMSRTKTDMAFRWFLGLGQNEKVPDHTNGTHFRERIHEEGLQRIFQDLIAQARAHGLISDRLRLKDATHILADVANLRPLALVAQVRETLWQAAKPLFADTVSQQRAVYEMLQQSTKELPDDERLVLRVDHLRGVTAVLQQQLADLPATNKQSKAAQHLQDALQVATKLLDDHEHPKAKNRLASAVDPDARCAKHTGFYVGYLLDVTMDPVSEIITAVNVLPANGKEAADAITLIHQEEQAQGNKVQGLSMDGAGYNGPLLHELTDPQGLNLDVTVPPPAPRQRGIFPVERFPLTVLADGIQVLTCPAGQCSGPGKPNPPTTTLYRFKRKQCCACPLREQCLEHPDSKRGRTVQKNIYQKEYDKVEQKAKTPEYQETRSVHAKVERKLNEIARHHRCRRARYRRQPKVFAQALWTALTVNIKRIVKLITVLVPTVLGVLGAPKVRAEAAGT